MRRSEEAFGAVEILISNAGIGQPHHIVDTPDEEWERVINVNLRATFALARAVMPSMIERQYGRVVTISSNIAYFGKGGASFATYGASKAGPDRPHQGHRPRGRAVHHRQRHRAGRHQPADRRRAR